MYQNQSKLVPTVKKMYIKHYDKLDMVGPVDNRPSIQRLAPTLCKKKHTQKITPDTRHVAPDISHLTCDI